MDHVGEYIQRIYEKAGYWPTRWHLVQTKVNDVYTTKCGRKFPKETPAKSPNTLRFKKAVDLNPYSVCYNCRSSKKV